MNANKRAVVAAVSALALVLGFVIPGAIPLAVFEAVALLLPLVAQSRLRPLAHLTDGARWFTGRTAFARFDVFTRYLGVAAWAFYALASIMKDGLMLSVFAGFFGIACTAAALIGSITLLTRPDDFAESVTFDRVTLTIKGRGGTRVVAYADITDVKSAPDMVWITTTSDRYGVPVASSPPALAAMIEQAKEGSARRATEAPAGPVALRRASGMGAREWLARVDAAAATARAAGAYRGAGGDLDDDRLLAILEADGEDAATRAAAARVLSRSDDEAVRVRVAKSVEAIEDAAVRVRIEVATKPDADEAAAEIEALDLAELRREAGALN